MSKRVRAFKYILLVLVIALIVGLMVYLVPVMKNLSTPEVSACVISSLIFFAVRKFGRKFVYSFCSKERIDKIENSKLFQNPKKIEWIMLLLFVIPGTPKDLLVYIAGLLPLKPLRFILISTFARLPSVVSSTFAGGSIVAGNWTHSIAIYAVTFLLVGIFIFVVNKFDKDKTAEEAMKIMK